MQFVHAVRGIASACLVSVLAACGGGGGGGNEPQTIVYPASNTVTINTGNTATPAGNYTLDRATVETQLEPTGDSRTIELASVEDTAGKFRLLVGFLQSDASKYILYYDDDHADYNCRSSRLSTAELAALVDGPANELPVCNGNVTIDAATHTLRASNVTLVDPSSPADKVVISINFAWTL